MVPNRRLGARRDIVQLDAVSEGAERDGAGDALDGDDRLEEVHGLEPRNAKGHHREQGRGEGRQKKAGGRGADAAHIRCSLGIRYPLGIRYSLFVGAES